MGNQPESRLSRHILDHLRKDGVFAFKVHGGPTMMAGLPDIIACVDGLFLGIEVKMPDKRANVSERQTYIHTTITRAGGTAVVVTSVAEARDAVARLRAPAASQDPATWPVQG